MQTLQADPVVQRSPSALALNHMLALTQKFWAAYSEYAWHYTGMLCEQHKGHAQKA
jgi:hypothetical protein